MAHSPPPQSDRTPPAFSKTVNGIQVAAWRNTSKAGKDYFSYSISKRYRDRDGNWKDGQLFGSDLLVVAELCNYMFSRCEVEGIPAVREDTQRYGTPPNSF